MKAENNIPTIDTSIAICTNVKDESTIKLLYGLVPDKYIMDSIQDAEEQLSKGNLYVELCDGCLCSIGSLNDFEIDKGEEFGGESPIIAFKSIVIDNLAFATLLQYAFSFTPQK